MLRSSVRFRSSITSHLYIDKDFLSLVNRQEIASHLSNLGPYPSYLSILTPQHFYQNAVLLEYLQKEAHPVLLRQLAGYGKTLTKQKVLASANFVRLELPIRLALRIRDLQTLPFGVVNNFHLGQIYESYYHLFNAFRKIPVIGSLEENDRFCETLLALLDDHVFNLLHLMMGALEVSILNSLPQNELDAFMSLMLRSRISRRVIVEEHLLLSESHRTRQNTQRPPGYIGELFHTCLAAENLQKVAELVKDSMEDVYPHRDRMPELELEGDVDSRFQFMVPHLHYLFGEILRNSYEATIKKHGQRTSKQLPPVKITVVDSAKEVVFRISDQGGGINHSDLSQVWLFGKSPDLSRGSLANFHRIPGLQMYANLQVTAAGLSIVRSQAGETGGGLFDKTPLGDINEHNSTKTKKLTLESLMTRPHEFKLGLGLPMCKVYADYWNGSLLMNSLEGYGSDTCLTLSKLGYHLNVIQLDRA